MVESYVLPKCPSVMLTQVDDDSDDVQMKPLPNASVQRSVSLQVHRKHADRNNNFSNLSPGGASSHFELANLLARAASFDAKFLRQLNEYESSERRLSTSSSTVSEVTPISFVEVGGLGRAGSFVHLPDRYSAAASNRRRSALRCGSISSSTSPIGPGHLDTVPECAAASLTGVSDVSNGEAWRRREDDALNAMKWLRQEIRQLKQHDRMLMRRLFELGTVIHQVNGGLHETVSCQAVDLPAASSPSHESSLNSALNWRPYVESDGCIQTSISQSKAGKLATSSLQLNNPRAVSMVDMRVGSGEDSEDSRPPIKTNSLSQMTSRASRLLSRLLPRTFRPTDQIIE